jgi:ribonuclease P protein component
MSAESGRFPRSLRLRSAADFRRVYEQGERAGDAYLLLIAAHNDLPWTRMGVSVSRRHGNAVRRNRKKRLLREAFRLSQQLVPAGLDLILIPRQRDDALLEDFRRSLPRLARRLTERLKAAASNRPSEHRAGD